LTFGRSRLLILFVTSSSGLMALLASLTTNSIDKDSIEAKL